MFDMTSQPKDSSQAFPWHSRYPEVGTGPLPIEPLLSQSDFEKQRDHVFKKCWLHVGRVDSIPKRGDYFVAQVDIAKASIIIVRQPDGGIGAFHNVCTHRGNKLVWNEKGRCAGFLACNFHGWVFDTKGNVANIPDIENFYDLDKASLGLKKVRVDVWEGFVFINLDAEGTQSLHDYLGEVVDRVAGFDFNRLPTHTHWRTKMRCNWRIIADAQLEGYHAPYLHARTLQDAFTGKENEHLHILDFETLGLHSVQSYPFNPDVKLKGVDELVSKYGTSMAQGLDTDSYELPSGLNASKAKNWQFDMFYIYPNFNLLLFRDSYLIHQYWPDAVDQSTWDVHLFQAKARTAAELFVQEQVKCFMREAATEDGGTHEHTQEAVESGAVKMIQLKDEEIGVRHSYVTLETMIAKAEAAQ